tara:strand:- start:109 stop:1416 length:1308 start_codon:yes stop_codon:yes gene_type:complete
MNYVTQFDLGTVLPKNFYESKQFKELRSNLESSKQSYFLTGKAGTGKSTFVEYFRLNTKKNVMILAYTGIVSIKCRGKTIHSFFKFPHHILKRKDCKILRNQDLLKSLNTLIIDEVSMVNPNLMDAIDRSLKVNRGNDLPFGGVQMLFVGDVFQLAPIAKGKEKEVLDRMYPDGNFFFNSKWFKILNPKRIEFEKIFRQKDIDFIQKLENIRRNQISTDVLNFFNKRVHAQQKLSDGLILLAPTNRRAYAVNHKKLAGIDKEEFIFKGTVTGSFKLSDMMSEKILKLKVGAQIMLTKNDPNERWVNGTIGFIAKLEKDKIFVKIGKRILQVEKTTWEKFDYILKDGKFEPKVIGKFEQYPIRLAWAATIHKCQGQTFEKAIIDFDSGSFAHGMTYVALSRVKSTDGLFLIRPVKISDIRFDNRIYKFQNTVELFN